MVNIAPSKDRSDGIMKRQSNSQSRSAALVFSCFCLLHPTVTHSQTTMSVLESVCDGDAEKGIEHVFSFAKKGNSAATFLLAMMFAENNSPDLTQKYLETSASQGSSNAMSALGQIAFNERDFSKAHNWFEAAAKLRNVNSLMYLGIMYRDGLGVNVSHEAAYFWFINAQKLKKTSVEGDIEPSEFASDVVVNLPAVKIATLSEDSKKWIEEHQEPPEVSIPPC